MYGIMFEIQLLWGSLWVIYISTTDKEVFESDTHRDAQAPDKKAGESSEESVPLR